MSASTKEMHSPFLDVSSFEIEEAHVVDEAESPTAWQESYSPFLSVYELESQADVIDPDAEEFASFLAELYDHEFEEAVFELANEAADLVESRFEGEQSAYGHRAAEQMLEEHFAPLVRELENTLENMADDAAGLDLARMGASEVEAFLDRYAPPEHLSPSFDQFFGKILKKVKKVAKKVASGVKKVASKLSFGAILKKALKLLKPLLMRVLRYAINKLPRRFRPLARKLARRFVKEVEEEAVDAEVALTYEEEAGGDLTQIQEEFDAQLAHLLFNESETEQGLALAEYAAEAEGPADEAMDQLDQARELFVEQLASLGEDAESALAVEQAVEQFIPAILPALKLGLRIVGRKRVVNFLADRLAKWIRGIVGRKYARPLSRAIVDAGLRLINLEATPEDEQQVAFEAVAATVEETVRQVAALPEYILDDEGMLEAAALEAFETAAAANLPPVLPEKVYERRPKLRESARVKGCWVKRPGRGKKRFYKKFTRVLNREITPEMASEVRTWRGVPLATVMKDMYGLPAGRTVRARVHIYEALPRTWLSRISKYERNVPGLGSSAKSAWSQLHPLTPRAAAVLLGEPSLGRAVSARYLVDPLAIGVGQRFYYLEFPEASRSVAGHPARRCCQTHLVFDFPGDQLRVLIYLSEAEAQSIAAHLRQRMSLGGIMTALRPVFASGIHSAFAEGKYHQVKIVHPAVVGNGSTGAALRWLPPMLQESLASRLVEWVERALLEQLRQSSQGFIAATEDPAAGLTLDVSLRNPPGFGQVRGILAGEPVALRGVQFSGPAPEARVRIVPGYWYG